MQYHVLRRGGFEQAMQFPEAEADCTLALAAGPSVKPLLRRGVARKNLDKLAEAEKDFLHALSLEPNNRCNTFLQTVIDDCLPGYLAGGSGAKCWQ